MTSGEGFIPTWGLDGVVYFPHYENTLDADTASFLARFGLPHTRFFSVRPDVRAARRPVELGPRDDAAEGDYDCPPERRNWAFLGWLGSSEVFVDPASGEIHSYPEGCPSILLHRDVHSFAYAVCEFQKIVDILDSDENREEALDRFTERLNAVDPAPLAHEESEWFIMIDEIGAGMV